MYRAFYFSLILLALVFASAALADDGDAALTFGFSDLAKTGPVGVLCAFLIRLVYVLDKRLEEARASLATLTMSVLADKARTNDILQDMRPRRRPERES